MATAKHTIKSRSRTSLVKQDADLMKVLVKEAVQAFFEERWIHALERTVRTNRCTTWIPHRYYQYNLITPIGTIELRVLRD